MQLILWRHAQAEDGSRMTSGDPRSRDMARELTLTGVKQAKATAAWLRPRLPPGSILLSSPAVRTVQTAQQLMADFERVSALAPDVPPAALLEAAGWPGTASDERTVVVVSHQPTLGRVASLLLTGIDRDLAVRTSGAWWFQSSGGGGASGNALRAIFDPALG